MNHKDLKSAINARIASLKMEKQQPENLYRPMHYILQLGGKRIRPVLCMMSYAAMSGRDANEALDLGLGLEIFHNFTLIHDDIMDRAPMRRGKPTAHEVWDENTAILAGDALFAYSLEMMVEHFPKQAAALCREYSRVSLGVCEGQMQDMDMAEKDDVSIADYLDMIRKKTAMLLGGCMSMGAIAAGISDKKTIADCKDFGESLGIAFQLQDDLMDAFPPEGFGKQVGGDIIENKKTYLLLRSFQLASEDQKENLNNILKNEKDNNKKVQYVLGLYNTLGIQADTQQLIADYVAKAQAIGEQLQSEADISPILEYLNEIGKREK